jgi:hypothetical protein
VQIIINDHVLVKLCLNGCSLSVLPTDLSIVSFPLKSVAKSFKHLVVSLSFFVCVFFVGLLASRLYGKDGMHGSEEGPWT